ncbi:AAEL007265-PA [Aedes aegypti]|uniref:AAEL007265-PA n=1 Tax=Aedes aegypti TaxID=7159 RepID=Q172W4_AEDAE|nr:AAEL007265-PA [Aedes aegypti]
MELSTRARTDGNSNSNSSNSNRGKETTQRLKETTCSGTTETSGNEERTSNNKPTEIAAATARSKTRRSTKQHIKNTEITSRNQRLWNLSSQLVTSLKNRASDQERDRNHLMLSS